MLNQPQKLISGQSMGYCFQHHYYHGKMTLNTPEIIYGINWVIGTIGSKVVILQLLMTLFIITLDMLSLPWSLHLQ